MRRSVSGLFVAASIAIGCGGQRIATAPSGCEPSNAIAQNTAVDSLGRPIGDSTAAAVRPPVLCDVSGATDADTPRTVTPVGSFTP